MSDTEKEYIVRYRIEGQQKVKAIKKKALTPYDASRTILDYYNSRSKEVKMMRPELVINEKLPPKKRRHSPRKILSKDREIPLVKIGQRRYPFAEIKIGENFLVESNKGDIDKKRRAVCGSGIIWAKKYGVKFTVRTEEKGIRVWRIE